PGDVAFAGREHVGRAHRGLRGRGFVAMHPVGEPNDRRRSRDQPFALGRGERAGVRQALVVALDLIELRQVARGRDREQHQSATLRGAAVVGEHDPIGGGVQGGQVVENPLPMVELGTQRGAEDRFRARDPRVERRQVEPLPLAERRQERRGGDRAPRTTVFGIDFFVDVLGGSEGGAPEDRQKRKERNGRKPARGHEGSFSFDQENWVSAEMFSRFIISWSVVGLTWSSSAARFCTPPAVWSALTISWRSKSETASLNGVPFDG